MLTLITVQFSSFSGLILCTIVEVWCSGDLNIEQLKKSKDIELDPMPNSTEIQFLAEALFLNKVNEIAPVQSFRSRKLNAVDVCELSKKKAMEFCLKLERVYRLAEGNYSLKTDGKVEECKPYTIVFYHTSQHATQNTVKARKCPFQPDELFITSGNRRIPVFVLAWFNPQRNYLHVDHYIDRDDDDFQCR